VSFKIVLRQLKKRAKKTISPILALKAAFTVLQAIFLFLTCPYTCYNGIISIKRGDIAFGGVAW